MSEYLTVARVCEETGMKVGAVYRWIHVGHGGIKLKSKKIGGDGATVVLRSDLEKFLKWRDEGVIPAEEAE